MFHASLCGSIRVCEGNPHPGRRACSRRQLELIYPPYERSRAFGSSVAGFVVGFRLAVASAETDGACCVTIFLSFRFILDPAWN